MAVRLDFIIGISVGRKVAQERRYGALADVMSRSAQRIVRRRLISGFYNEELSALPNELKYKMSPLPDEILPDGMTFPDGAQDKMSLLPEEINYEKPDAGHQNERWSTAFNIGESLGENLGLTVFAILGLISLVWLGHHLA